MASKPCLIVIALLGSALNCALVEGFKSAGKGSLLSENKFQHGNEMKGAEMKEISSNEEPRAERVGKKLPADRERKR